MKRPFVLGLAALTALVALPFVPDAASGAPSPRDTRIVFSRNGVGNHDIYSMTSIGTNVVALLNPAGVEDLNPVVSPDGKQIALTRYGAGPDELWVMNADGSGLTAVPGSGRTGPASWSPDGKRLAYECREPLWSDRSYICVRDVTGANFQLLSWTVASNDRAPDWSPDGTRIAWTRWTGGSSQLLVLTLKSTSLDPITPLVAGRHDYDVAWSPDSKQVAFSRYESGSGLGSSLYRIPASGGPEKLIIAGPPIANDTYLTMPSWSADGTTIAYSARDDDEGWGNIWTITPNGKNNTQLTFGTATDMSPDWLPI
jgi:Tol biopolymer transport system component